MSTPEPARIVRGDSVRWSRKWAAYPAPTWTATWYWHGAKGEYSAEAVSDPDDPEAHLVELDGTETAKWGEGTYAWAVHLTDGTEVVTVEGGRLCVDLAAAERTGDPRTRAEEMLDAIEATLAGKATHDQLSYSLQGTSLARLPPEDLERWRALYAARVDREHRERERRAGRPVSGNTATLVRM